MTPRAIVACVLPIVSFFGSRVAAQTSPPASPAPPSAPLAPPPSTPVAPPPGPFAVQPITDGAIVAVNAGFAGLLDLVMGTGELRAQQISPTFEPSSLLEIDRGAISQHVDPNAAMYSNIGMGVALGYAILDPIASAFREKSARTALVDGILYAETITITIGVTNLAKIAVRRPRPSAYVAAQEQKHDPTYANPDTDSSLSFFSGHSSVSAAISATATYLAFVRSPRTARPWITLIAGTALTSFVAFERVRAGKHFPTDVIAGALAGAGIGVLVPHFHRVDAASPRTFWVGAGPAEHGVGGTFSLSGSF
ncbi:phosphatase PAP2 family protein [Pendulispora albinea]|uniref:Phosphatase PAP2 family protein n=1 Tax=Pendulispora albinea TaxID=2741071 RepID=A0ABZ2LZ02_9BACT